MTLFHTVLKSPMDACTKDDVISATVGGGNGQFFVYLLFAAPKWSYLIT